MTSLNAKSRKRFSSRFTSAARLSNWRTSGGSIHSGSVGSGAKIDLLPQDFPSRKYDSDEFSAEYAQSDGSRSDSEALGRKGVLGLSPGRSRRWQRGEIAPDERLHEERIQVNGGQSSGGLGEKIRTVGVRLSPLTQENKEYQTVNGEDSTALMSANVYDDGNDDMDPELANSGANDDDAEYGHERKPPRGDTRRPGCFQNCIICLFYAICWVVTRLLFLLVAISLFYGFYRLVLDLRRSNFHISIPGGGTGPPGGQAPPTIAPPPAVWDKVPKKVKDGSQSESLPPPQPMEQGPAAEDKSKSDSPPPPPMEQGAPAEEEEEDEVLQEIEDGEILEGEEWEYVEVEKSKGNRSHPKLSHGNDFSGKQKQEDVDVGEDEKEEEEEEQQQQEEEEQEEQEKQGPESTISAALSASDPNAVFDAPRFQSFYHAILSKDLSDPDTLLPTQPLTPQFRALDWLANTDPMQLDPTGEAGAPSSSDVEPEYIFRYALAVLWFSTHATLAQESSDQDLYVAWSHESEWLSGKSVCDWQGVNCQGYYKEGIPEHLKLYKNGLVGTIPPELFTVLREYTTEIRLGHNKLRGNLPSHVGRMEKLLFLDLHHNELNGTIPVELFEGNENLRELRLNANSFRGTVPPVKHWNHMEAFDVGKNDLSGTLPKSIKTMKKLFLLSCGNNRFEGSVPNVSGMDELRYLLLYRNKLSGKLYETLPASLEVLQVDGNQLTGSISNALATHGTLKQLTIRTNQISSTIPNFLDLPSLKVLSLSRNRFTGSIPGEGLARSPELERIEMESNNLEGKVPEEIGHLEKLKHLSIQQNHITDKVPESICQLRERSLAYLVADCGGDQPKVQCDCCSKCAGN